VIGRAERMKLTRQKALFCRVRSRRSRPIHGVLFHCDDNRTEVRSEFIVESLP
jgi:hypothetical protein